jgi:hypothetical protein
MAAPFGIEAAAIVKFSIEKGQVWVRDVWEAIDPGNIVNPAIVGAQVNGAVALALSQVLLEEAAYESSILWPANSTCIPSCPSTAWRACMSGSSRAVRRWAARRRRSQDTASKPDIERPLQLDPTSRVERKLPMAEGLKTEERKDSGPKRIRSRCVLHEVEGVVVRGRKNATGANPPRVQSPTDESAVTRQGAGIWMRSFSSASVRGFCRTLNAIASRVIASIPDTLSGFMAVFGMNSSRILAARSRSICAYSA